MAPLIPGEVSISNKILIDEVKKRPALYDRSLQDYTNQAAKNHAWRDIAESIFSDRWKNWSNCEKDTVLHAIQKRWMNLRSCFSRELRKQIKYDDNNQDRRRKYRYYKNMLFLQKFSSVQGVNETQGSEGYRSDNSCQEDEDSESDYSVPIKREKKEFEIMDDPLDNTKPRTEPIEIPIQNLDQDINFVMSLVPMFRELPVSQKLKLQVEILKLFQQVVK